MEFFNKFIEYVKTTCWFDDTETSIVISQAEKVFNVMIENKTRSKILYRLCGQTGSGKTTQLLSAVEHVTLDLNLNPVVLGVRSCAEYHPKYEEFKKNFPAGELREKTNGFALKCMGYVLKLLIENGYMILLDITLLDPIFEEYVLNLLKVNNYIVHYHILAVNKTISDEFIVKRFKSSGRVIYKTSSDYFYEILSKGLKFICENDDKNNCFIWNAFDLEPVYFGKISKCYDIFIKTQNEIKDFIYTEDELRNSKYEIIKKHL